MAYQIKKTDGTIIATVADGQVDQLSTDLTLIGKNFSGYGDELNENFVRLLENFADTTRPTNPITGQLWFDTTETTLKIYSGQAFVPVSSTAISDSQPASLRVGDLWFDSVNKQLKFYNGSGLVLISPQYTAGQGKSGFEVESILDTLGQTRVVTMLYNAGTLLGIFSTASFTPKNLIPGYSGDIITGFNVASLAGAKFDVTCTNSEKLGGYPFSDYIRTSGSTLINGDLTVASDVGISIGVSTPGVIALDDGDMVISNFNGGDAIRVEARQGGGVTQETAIKVLPNTRTVELYGDYTTSSVKIGGQLTVEGDLTVNGETTTLSTSELVVEDKNIILAKQPDQVSSDANADGAGVTVEGDTDHTMTWNISAPFVSAPTITSSTTGAFTFSENVNLEAGRFFAINGKPLLQPIDPTDPATSYKLSDHITAIDGIGSILANDDSKKVSLRIGPLPEGDPELLRIENTTITTYSGLDLEFAPAGNIVLTGSPEVKGLADPVDSQDAATKNYVDTELASQTIFLSTTLNSPTELLESDYYDLLNTMVGTSQELGTLVKLLTTVVSTDSQSVPVTVNTTTESFLVSDGAGGLSGNDAPGITSVGIPNITVPAQVVTVSRSIKTFRMEGLGWNLIADDPWTP